jgi:pimeloyl-ACP methyl ester carboxylesterase
MTIESTKLSVRGIDLEVLRGGGGAETFVVLHGILGLDANSALLAELASRGEVIAPLLPGYGTSPEAPTVRTMLDVTLLMLDVLDIVGGDPILVGHSMGGMVAAEMASIAANDVQRLALVAPLGLWLDEHPIPDVFAMTPQQIVDVAYADGGHERDALDHPEHLAAVLVRTLRQLTMAGKLLFPIPYRGLSDRIHRIRARTAIVWGSEDRYLHPAYVDAFASAIAHARTSIVAGGAHRLTEERSAEVVDAVTEHLVAVAGAVS